MGIIGGGCEIMRYAWPTLDVAFSIQHENETIPSSLPRATHTKIGPHRTWPKLFQQHPVDLLVVERGDLYQPTKGLQSESWEKSISSVDPAHRPKVVVESWRSDAHLWMHGPVSKAALTRWSKLGYDLHCRRVNATAVGGAVNQDRLLVVHVAKDQNFQWEWGSLDRDQQFCRPMENLLTPPGLVPRNQYIRHSDRQHTPKSKEDPMPPHVGALISTEKGTRRLTKEEFARGLGIPKGDENNLNVKSLHRSTSLFHWEYLSTSLERLGRREFAQPNTQTRNSEFCESAENTPAKSPNQTEDPRFEWKPPDLSTTSDWCRDRTANLREAAETYPNPKEVYDDGLIRLEFHRNNWTPEGPDPKRLQLIWWEFPAEHWEELRLGARQNFMKKPQAEIRPNAPMDADMTAAAIEFVDELVELGIMRAIEEGYEVLTNAPLFVVPKPGQPGQWRVIADMLRGGQNECVGQDPVYMPRISQILDHMYTGGYSAVVDLSKFFYNFPTHAEDRPYLGILHPGTKELLAYYGLAMGAGNSPAIACRLGLAFVRLVKERFEEFQGKARANCYWTKLSDNGFDPELGYGFILEGADGGAAHIWVWVDDFLIHGPTYEKTAQALRFFLDTALVCGFLFHPKKLIPPCQAVKYCGFIFDTTGVPCLRIPEAKRERALAICEYLVDSPRHKKWSRLSLAVAAGVLESLSEATPRRLGHTHLREFHSLVHPPGIGTGAMPYYTTTELTEPVLEELRWWIQMLTRSEGRFVRSRNAATLTPTFGDGSGTGTGGTIQIPNCPFEVMWQGKWLPSAYHFPSVWKELATLKETFLRIKESPYRNNVRETTLFYFTDNSGVYWIATLGSSKSRNLHKLIGEIRLLELDLLCHLVVVHVPGLVLITQGTDGLSRGVWMSRFHSLMDSKRLTQAIFDPVTFDPSLVWQALPMLAHRDQCWSFRSWDQPWKAHLALNQTTVWCPPPEIAGQLLTFLLNSWVERPYTTSALIFIPRVLEATWRHLSKYAYELTVIYPHQTPLRFPPVLPIPIVAVYIPPHQRCLTPRRMGLPSMPAPAWHAAEAAHMRGLGFDDFAPCGATYHIECFRVGEPFTSRRKGGEGLCFPKDATWPNFICEACTVRQFLGRELVSSDAHLLMLERMRLLDIISYWAKGTHKTYAAKLRVIEDFEATYGVRILSPTPLDRPPSDESIPLMWCQQRYSLRHKTDKSHEEGIAVPIAFTTIRQLRSAASQYMALDALSARPGAAYFTSDKKLIHQECRPTDSLAYTLMTKGMLSRIGDEAKPSVALLDRHVRFLDNELNEAYLASTSPHEKRDLALAGLANLSLWLGWLRSNENWDTDWEDSELIHPEDGPRLELPPNCGLLQYRLSPETKSNRGRRADVLMASTTMSGLCIEKWYLRAQYWRPTSTGPIFRHLDGSRWTSKYFRQTYLYPSLHRQREAGDKFLAPFDGSPGNRIEDKFWSLHCYRRGARSHVSRGGHYGTGRLRKATKEEIYEHARWRLRRSTEPIDVIYREWTPLDRIAITFYCH